MFEDLKKDGGAGANMGNVAPTAPKAPVADMFAEVDPNVSPDGLIKPSAIQSGKIKPVSNNNWPAPENNVNAADQMLVSDGHNAKSRKLIIIIAVTVLVLAFVGGAYFIFKDRINGLINKNVNTNQNTNANTNTNRNTNQNTNANTNTNPVSADDDFDGLDNETEKTLGTNPLSVDTDNDGLSDRDEVKTYKTDPLKSDTDDDSLVDGQEIRVWFTDPLLFDTDNDSYSDGQEVGNGYNPKGSGKLNTTTTVPGLFEMNTNTNTNTNFNTNNSNLSQ